MDLKKYITNVPDFPKKGINFKDISSLMLRPLAFKESIDLLTAFAKPLNVDVVVGPESRGFIFGCPISYNLGVGFVPIRKPGKLPREVISADYTLEYATNTITMHKDAIKPGQRVLIVDDILATGGTIRASIKLVKQLGGIIVGICFLAKLKDLNGDKAIQEYNHFTILDL